MSGYSEYYYFHWLYIDYTEYFTASLAWSSAILLELSVAWCLLKLWKYILAKESKTALVIGTVSVVFLTATICTSIGGISHKNKVVFDYSLQIKDSVDSEVLLRTESIDKQISFINKSIDRIDNNPALWSNGSFSILSENQHTEIAKHENSIAVMDLQKDSILKNSRIEIIDSIKASNESIQSKTILSITLLVWVFVVQIGTSFFLSYSYRETANETTTETTETVGNTNNTEDILETVEQVEMPDETAHETTEMIILRLKSDGVSYAQIGVRLNISKTMAYRIHKRSE